MYMYMYMYIFEIHVYCIVFFMYMCTCNILYYCMYKLVTMDKINKLLHVLVNITLQLRKEISIDFH